MKELSKIVELIDKNRPRKVEVLGNEEAESKHAELYELLKKGSVKTDEEAAVFLYQLTVRSGQFEIVKRSVAAISPDRRMQALLIAFSFVSKIIALPFCGRLAKRLGARRLLTLGGIGIIPMAGMWYVSDNYVWLCFTQITAGIAWAAYELAFLLLFFESIPATDRVSVLTLFNLLNSAALASWPLARICTD